jgi:hypothetical protein
MRKIRKQNVTKQIILSKALLSEAGLGKNVEIIVQDGAILVLPAVKKGGWQLLEKLGKDAAEGTLDQPSQQHDLYLYGKQA